MMSRQADRGPGSHRALTSDLPMLPPPTAPRPLDERHHADHAPAHASGRRISARLVLRAVRRHWWQALILWVAGSAGLVTLAHHKVKPTYDAFSIIKIDPGDRGLFRENNANVDFEIFKETQVNRVTMPNVIATAFSAHPELLRLPRLAQAQDPEAEVRQAVSVGMISRTHLIKVSMSSQDAGEAAQIVNAVIEAYLRVALDASEEETEKRSRRLREAKEERTLAVRQKRDAIAALVSRLGMVDVREARDRNSVSVEAYSVLTNQHLQADLDLVEAQARLDQLRAQPVPEATDSEEAAIVSAFYATPQVAEARARLEKAKDEVAKAERIARSPSDPARLAPRKRADDLQRQIDNMWATMKPALIARGSGGREAEIRAAELRAAGLQKRLDQLGERLEKMNIQTKAAGSDELKLEFARQDLARAEAVLDTVTKGLDQVEFEAKDPVARFRQDYKARASNTPNRNHRRQAMAAAPAGMLAVVVALMVLVELHAGRVGDPEDLPSRARLTVLGVVPPLPRSAPTPAIAGGREDTRSRRDLDQFIRSLDHLRVAICSSKFASGRPRRVILITSACSGEGKTTLAAQLAERCVNAGLLTLLIDADIRNPTLSRMFDMPTSRGLANVLRGESAAEEAITVVGGAGGFYFMPAGSPRLDPSRLLQGDGMSRLLASARESFDLVIVDSPPVLPVPDALTIGRSVDGAVIAVRFDNSRYPLVERANRRLASLGVPVIGAVVSGFRGPEATGYGTYYASTGPLDDEDGPSDEG